MDYIKLFDEHEDYEEYMSGSTKTFPNVAYCIDANDVHYNPSATTSTT